MTEVITPPRSDVPVDRTWDAESVFASAEAWEAALEALLADLPRLEGLAGRLGEGPEVTIEALVARDDLMRHTGHVFVYAYLDYAVDTTGQDAVALREAQTAFGQVLAAVAFIEPELLELGRDRLVEWSAERSELLRTSTTSTISSAAASTSARSRSRSCSASSRTPTPGRMPSTAGSSTAT